MDAKDIRTTDPTSLRTTVETMLREEYEARGATGTAVNLLTLAASLALGHAPPSPAAVQVPAPAPGRNPDPTDPPRSGRNQRNG